MEISVKDYMERQPRNPKVEETDQFYLWIALRLAKLWDESPWLRGLDDEVRRDVVLAVTGYYQDVVADGGLWRSFTRMHNARNGNPVPHYDVSDDYVDFELNVEDVRYVMWWTIAGEAGSDVLDWTRNMKRRPCRVSSALLPRWTWTIRWMPSASMIMPTGSIGAVSCCDPRRWP